MKVIAVEDGDQVMYFCGFAPDNMSKEREELPTLCYNKDARQVKRYEDNDENLAIDLGRLHRRGINAFAE